MKKTFLFAYIILISMQLFGQEPFDLYEQHNGQFDFTMIGATFNRVENPQQPCSLLDLDNPPTAQLTLENDQSVVAAYLYWSANTQNFNSIDQQVTFNGNPITADDSYTISFGGIRNFFCGVADVTTIVQNQGNGQYILEDLDLFRPTTGELDCSISYGGWSVVVVYEDADLSLNSVNIYDGFQGVSGSSAPLTITVTDILVAQTFGSFIGILGWEGDQGIDIGETVSFNGNPLSNDINPVDNLFNGTNSFENITGFHNMDLDRFDISEFVEIGDESAEFTVASAQDLAIVNALVFTLNSELPEPTIEILSAESDCSSNQINIELEVRNFNANEVLPANTSVKLYIDEVSNTPDLELFTSQEIPIGGTETLTASLPYPDGDPASVTIFASVNLDNNGDPILLELNSNNNRDNRIVDVAQPPQITIDPLEQCDIGTGFGIFDLDALIEDFETNNPNLSISIHSTFEDAENNVDSINGDFTSSENPQSLWARQTDLTTQCVGIVEFQLITNETPQTTNAILRVCSDNDEGDFVLSNANPQITSETGVDIFYFESMEEVEDPTATPLPDNYTAPNNTTLFARVTFTSTGCFSAAELTLLVFDIPQDNTVSNESFCEDGGIVTFDLTSKLNEILGNQDPTLFEVTFHTSLSDAENDINAISTPENYQNTTSPETIFIRVENVNHTECFRVLEFDLIVNPNPVTSNAVLQECSDSDTATFTLSNANNFISSEDVNILYFATLAEAEDETATALPDVYTSPTATVFARVTLSTGCWATAELDLEVFINPLERELQDEFLCEDDDDEVEIFDLTEKTEEILGEQDPELFNVSFHLNLSDAQNDTGAIENPENHQNSSNPETIFVRVENLENQTCAVVMPFDLIVNQNPPANNVPISIPTCSMTESAIFDLDAIAIDVAAGDATMDVEFYEDQELQNRINNTAAYETSTTTVYGRVINPNTNCFSIGEVLLTVLSEPEQVNLPLEQCAINEENNTASFNLTSLTSQIIGSAQNVTVTYHENFADADSPLSGGENAISNVTDYSSQTTTIFARSEASYEGDFCHTVSEIELIVYPRPLANEATYQICSDNNEEVFDLTTTIPEIIGNQTDVEVLFFEDSNLQNEISNSSSYNSVNRTVYALVTNTNTQCQEQTEVDLQIVPDPALIEPITLESCRVEGVATFDLSSLQNNLTQQYPNFSFTFFEDEATNIALSDIVEVTQSTTIYARIDLDNAICFSIEEVELIVPPTPVEDNGRVVICLSQGYTLPNGETVFETGQYDRPIPDENGCDILTKTTLIVGEIDFPNAFAPNSNNNNEGFGALPSAECVGEVSDYYFVVYNRWGEKVFETTDFTHTWDGRHNGQLQEGTYLWYATYTFQDQEFERSGSVVLLF